MKKKSIFIIVAGILAAGCNNGALSQASNTKDQENNFQPKSLQHFDYSPELDAIFKRFCHFILTF